MIFGTLNVEKDKIDFHPVTIVAIDVYSGNIIALTLIFYGHIGENQLFRYRNFLPLLHNNDA